MKQRISLENAAEVVRHIVTEYYHLNFQPFFSVLSQNCVWILPVGYIVTGAESIRDFQKGLQMIPLQVGEAKFEVFDTGSPDQIGVFGVFSLIAGAAAVQQRITMLFHKEEDGFRLYHLHTSNEWDEGTENGVFPAYIERCARPYTPKPPREDSRHFVFKADSSTYCFDLDMILYVEATGKVCTVYMLNRTMVIRQPLKAFEAQFPRQFCRIHRSYLVNCRYVLQIERYSLTLTNGAVLPIPAKRYIEVRESISERLA